MSKLHYKFSRGRWGLYRSRGASFYALPITLGVDILQLWDDAYEYDPCLFSYVIEGRML